MILKAFLQKYLPNYEEKIKELDNEKNLVTRGLRYRHFQDKYFPEALQNFANKICREQLDNAFIKVEPLFQEALVESHRLDQVERFLERVAEVFSKVKQPNIDDL